MAGAPTSDPWSGIGSSLVGLVGGIFGQSQANRANRDLAQEQMNFQKHMSDSAHQREVNDLRAAGLNPILSANAGASSPPGAMATMQNEITPGISSAIEARRLSKEIDAVGSQVALNAAQAKTAQAVAEREQANARLSRKQTELLEKTMPAAVKRALLEEQEINLDSKFLPYRYHNRLIQEGLGTVNSAMDAIKPKIRINGGDKTPNWVGTGSDGTKYHKKTGEVLERKGK